MSFSVPNFVVKVCFYSWLVRYFSVCKKVTDRKYGPVGYYGSDKYTAASSYIFIGIGIF